MKVKNCQVIITENATNYIPTHWSKFSCKPMPSKRLRADVVEKAEAVKGQNESKVDIVTISTTLTLQGGFKVDIGHPRVNSLIKNLVVDAKMMDIKEKIVGWKICDYFYRCSFSQFTDKKPKQNIRSQLYRHVISIDFFLNPNPHKTGLLKPKQDHQEYVDKYFCRIFVWDPKVSKFCIESI